MLLESLVAWCWTPLLLAVSCGAVGLLVERAANLALPTGLVVALGFAVVIVTSTLVYTLGGQTPIVIALVGLMAGTGVWLGRSTLRGRLRPGWLAGGALVTYGLYLLPVVASGAWTWTGYNFVNDTASHFLLIDYLSQQGTDPVAGAASSATLVQSFVSSATYPIGAHAPLAAALALIPAPLEATYNPYIAFAMALAAYAFAVLLRFAGLPERLAAAGAVVAAAASLTYQYAMQGNFKEVIVLALVATAAALIGIFVSEGARSARGIVPPVVCVAAAVLVFSAGAFAYGGGLVAALVVAIALSPARLDLRRFGRWAAIGAGVVAVATLPLLGQLVTFAKDAAQRFSDSRGGGDVFDTTAVLAHLYEPLELTQVAGIWFRGDYRLPVLGIWTTPNAILIGAVLVLALAGIVIEVRRRRPAALLLAVPVLLVLVVAGSITTPYIDGKLYAIASPALLLLGAVALHTVGRRFGRGGRVGAGLVGLAVAGGVLLSVAFAYREVSLAPIDRFEEVEAVGDRLTGGPWLVNEWEEFAKYYLRDEPVYVANDQFSPRQAAYRGGIARPLHGRWYDLDAFELDYLHSFPRLLTRRSPAESHPPVGFERMFTTERYVGWRAPEERVVRAHLPIGRANQAGATPDCSQVRLFVAGLRPDERLVAAIPPEYVAVDVFRRAPPGWPRIFDTPVDVEPLTVIPKTPLDLTQRLSVEGGRYEVWVRGSFPRAVTVSIDGREVGKAEGVAGPRQWHLIGERDLEPGAHPVRVERGDDGFGPGDGAEGRLGPVALRRKVETRVVEVDPANIGALCGRELDWIERVRR